MSKRVPILTVALAAAFIAATPAQSQVLQVSVTAAGATTFLASGGSLGLTSPGTGQAVFANVTVRYVGTTSATITGETLNGTSDMTLLQTVTPPITLSPNSSTTFTVQYLPGTGLTATAQVIIGYTEGSVASSFAFVLNGSSARLTFSYFLSPGGATTTLNAGDRIAFPSTTVGSSVTAVVSVVNSGATASSLQSVGLSGSSFQITGSPAPIQLGPGQQASFNVVFTPQTSGSLQGTLAVGFANSSVSFNLTGTGASPSFTVTYTLADGNVHALSDGSAISFPAVDINGTAAATIDIVNQGTGSGSVTGISVGGSGFRIVSLPAALPATVGVGQDLRFQIVFNPSQAGSFSGTFRISLSGSSVSGTLAGATATPNFTLAYVDPDTNNTIALQDGGAIAFPSTLVNAVSSITLVATNTGAGTGLINSITLGGSSPSVFQILNQPSLPASVPPTQQVRFGVRFSPQQAQTFSATMVLNLNGQTITINLTAQGTGAQFTYSWTNAAGTTTISPGGTIPIGNTSVGQTSSLTISVSNSGSGDGQVAALAVSGLGLTMANLPAVPFTLHPKGSQTFTLTFAPTQPGAINGTLTIGTDTFTIAATGVGARLIYTYTNAASTVSLVEGGVVILQPTAVESNASVSFSIQNTGTSDATISSINLAAVSAIFSLQQLPGLPMNLKPGDTVTFAVNFVPNAVGSLTAILNINNSSFTLSGTGTPPAALPSFQFQGPSGTQPAAQQPTVGLTLAAPYPLALQGSLTLTFTSAVFTDDPAIQFAAGGRKVNFTIPANSTQAVFTAGATSMPLQTGTTAGTILITPSFATQSGFDMTPPSPAALTLTIQRSAVQLSSASVTAETLTSFTVVLKGYSTTRTVTKLDIDISSKPGVSFSTSHLTLDVSSASSAWYQSNTSQAFGGAFLIAVPFVLSNGGSATDLVHMLQSLNITATNDVGTSSAASVAIP